MPKRYAQAYTIGVAAGLTTTLGLWATDYPPSLITIATVFALAFTAALVSFYKLN